MTPTQPMPEAEINLEAQKTLQKLRQLRQSNIDAWTNKPDPTKFTNLDSNLKKNTAFITKCRAGVTADTAAMLHQGIKTLKLEKYLSEIVVAVVEGIQKCKLNADIAAAAEVISALHQRFPDTFTPPFNQALVRALAPPVRSQLMTLPAEQREKDEASRVQKQRTLLRVAGELWLLGVLLSKKEVKAASANKVNVGGMTTCVTSTPAVGKERDRKDTTAGKEKEKDRDIGGVYYCIMKDLLASDKNLHVNIPLAVAFVKHFGNEVLGIVPRKQQLKRSRSMDEQAQDKGLDVIEERPLPVSPPAAVDTENVVTEEQQGLFKALLMEFFENVSTTLISGHKTLRQLEKKNNEWYIKIGEIPEETKANFERMQKAYEKFLANAQMLSDGLDVSLPELLDIDDASKVDSIISNSGSSFNREDSNSGIWEDEEEKMFYEDVIDLKDLVPPVLLERKRKMSTETEGKKDDESEKDDDNDFEIDEKDMEGEYDVDEYEGNEESLENMMKRMGIDDDEAAGDDPEDILDKDPAQNSTIDGNAELGSIKPGRSIQLEALLSRLNSMVNRDMIDKAAVEYCYMNSKGARKLLVKALLTVPKYRLDLLPYYSRLIATLNKYFPEIGAAIVKVLDHEFRFYIKTSSKKGIALAPQIRNIRYIGELTKFKVIPEHIIFHTLKVLIELFKAGKVEVCCNLVESCGRYLLRNPESSVRMKGILDIMMRKKTVQHLDGRQQLMVENAYYMCNPPDRPVVVRRERPPIELYVRKLIYGDLSKKTAERTLKQLRKLPWGQECDGTHSANDQEKENREKDGASVAENNIPRSNGVDEETRTKKNAEVKNVENETKESEKLEEKGGTDALGKPKSLSVATSLPIDAILLKIFTKIWKVRYSNVHLLAILVQGLARYHQEFAVSVVDQILEDIRFGLESNIFKYNQRRISQIKFLGELYNYRVIESPVIFDTLYTIVTLGHEHGRPAKYRPSPIDSLDDFFRVRLCCTLLDTCGMCFDRGSSKIKLDAFLAFFQMYIFSKNDMPMDVEFMVADIFEALRPKMKRFESYEEAAEEVDNILFGNLKAIKETGAGGNEGEASDYSASDAEDDEGGRHQEAAESGDEEEVGGEQEQGERNGNGEEEEDDVVVFERQRALDEADTAADAEFEREFGKLMSESVDSRKFERKATFDLPIPMHLKGHATAEKSYTDTEAGPAVAFTLLTKKGNKQQLRTMEIPSNSPLAVNTKSKQEAEREEQQRLKQLVLSYEEREQLGNNRPQAIEDPYRRYGSRQFFAEDENDPLVGPMQSSQRRHQRGREQKVFLVGGGGGGAAYQRRH